MAGGRPRIEPTKEETIALGQDLVRWISEPIKEGDFPRTTWALWYAYEKGMIQKDWKRLKEREEFLPYYETARSVMAQKLHRGDVKEGIAHRYLRLYDVELRNQEDADKDADLQRKVEAARSLGDSAKAQLSEFLDKEKS